MRLFRSDLPLTNDTTGRFLPWLITVMVFLATLALSAVLAMNSLMSSWKTSMTGTLTIQLPLDREETDRKDDFNTLVERVVRLVASFDAVTTVRPIEREKVHELLEPWLGTSEMLDELPLPQMIEVMVNEKQPLDIKVLTARIQDIIPGALVDDHRVWLSRWIHLAKQFRLAALGILVLVGITTTATVIYATRTSLAVHRPHIEVLHLIGATDDYVAQQFARRALFHGFAGGCLGVILAIPILAGAEVISQSSEMNTIQFFDLNFWNWLFIITIPLITSILTHFSAHRTVRHQLARML